MPSPPLDGTPLLDFGRVLQALESAPKVALSGRVVRASGVVVEALLPSVALGAACVIECGAERVLAECVGFAGERAILMPVGDVRGIHSGAVVVPLGRQIEIKVSDALLGRVVDARLTPVDGRGPLAVEAIGSAGTVPLHRAPPAAMARRRIDKPFLTGVKVIDALLTCGEGQRVGIFAGAGVGKSVLMGMLAKHCEADVIVVGLVGERGREVREFIERDLGPEGVARSVVVVATGDTPPLERVHAAHAATAVAEHYRAQGKRVLLMMDSLTRVAMALREIGLSAEEPPTSKGYPPSVFAALPRLLERAGNDDGRGAITALYTVLVEGDDMSDPVADCARAALDGHIVLSRKLAGGGHFPAVDVLQSVSRVMLDIVEPPHRELAQQARDVLAALHESQDLVDVGAYVAGSNPRVDRALATKPALLAFLQQAPKDRSGFVDTLTALKDSLRTPSLRKESAKDAATPHQVPDDRRDVGAAAAGRPRR